MPIRYRRRYHRGFTLTEMLLVVSIIGIVASLGSILLVQFQNFYFSANAHNTVQRDARQSLDAINRMLRQAVGSSIVIYTPRISGNYQGAFSGISFNTVEGSQVSFYQNGNQLIEKVGNNVSVLSRNLAYLAFSFPNTSQPTIVNVALSMSQNVQLGRKQVFELSNQSVGIMN